MSLFDPDLLCRNGCVTRIIHGRASVDEAVPWKANIVFQNGDSLLVSGTWTVTDGLSVWDLKMPLPEGKYETVPSVPGKTLLQALGDLSSIPVRLQRCLAPTGLKPAGMAKIAMLWGNTLFSLEEDALFYGVEDGEVSAGRRPLFDQYVIRYYRSDLNGPIKVEISSKHLLAEGRIVISTEIDVYGLSCKKVALDRNLGMGRRFCGPCTKDEDKYRSPSLKAAFDLDAALPPAIYGKERRTKVKKGVPKAKGK